ncbi:MAG: hypothetical protein D6705_04775 [Deltaproteobacteria bacterium]|nr:MAG: hypothetical protein D6705_04775 [Deltaproteobacteria bacterium]
MHAPILPCRRGGVSMHTARSWRLMRIGPHRTIHRGCRPFGWRAPADRGYARAVVCTQRFIVAFAAMGMALQACGARSDGPSDGTGSSDGTSSSGSTSFGSGPTTTSTSAGPTSSGSSAGTSGSSAGTMGSTGASSSTTGASTGGTGASTGATGASTGTTGASTGTTGGATGTTGASTGTTGASTGTTGGATGTTGGATGTTGASGTAGGTTGGICLGGTTGGTCPMGQTLCGGDCVDTDIDRDHCGGCNQPCPAGAFACDGGTCVATKVWEPPVQLTAQAQGVVGHAVAVDDAGNAELVWRNDANGLGDGFEMRFDAAIQAWSAPLPLGPVFGKTLSVALDGPTGVGHVAWDTLTMSGTQVLARRFDGSTWGPEEIMSTTGTDMWPVGPVVLAADGNRTAGLFVNSIDEFGEPNQLVEPFFDGTNWTPSPPPIVGFDAYFDDAWWGNFKGFDVAMIPGTGASYVAWSQYHSVTGRYVVAARMGMPAIQDPQIIGAFSGDCTFPAIAADAQGRVVVVWMRDDPGVARGVYASRYDGTWKAPVPLEVDPTRGVGAPRIAMNSAGDATVVFRQEGGGGGDVLWAVRYDAVTDTWHPAEALDVTCPSSVVDWEVTMDETGDAMVAWVAAGSLFARRFSSTTQLWRAPVNIEQDPGPVTDVEIASTADGEVFAAWRQQVMGVEQVMGAWYR